MTATEDRIRSLPLWRGPIDIAPLKGGLSNESFVVTEPGGRHVVRFGRDFPFHHVFRDRETMTARAAHAAGFGPEVRYAAPGVMVTAYLGAKTFGPQDVCDHAPRVADLLRRFHESMARHVAGPGFMFWVFHVIRDYARTLEAGGSRMRSHLAGYVAIADGLEAEQIALPIVFAHNDLLPANILDDGRRLWLIDFEYAGFNTALFDLAGAASNAGMIEAQADAFVASYFGRTPESDLLRALSAMQCASLLREAMWSMVSELHLDAPGADYVSYTAENLDRMAAALDRHRSRWG